SCASCWVRARRGSGETGVACFFCWFISCSRDGKLGIGSTEVESQRPASNPWRAHEPEYAAGSAKNQLLAPQAARSVPERRGTLGPVPCCQGIYRLPGSRGHPRLLWRRIGESSTLLSACRH